MPLLAGFRDEDLDPQVVEALKVLGGVQDEYTRKVGSIDAQYLKALEASHDGVSAKCRLMLAQVKAVRARFKF